MACGVPRNIHSRRLRLTKPLDFSVFQPFGRIQQPTQQPLALGGTAAIGPPIHALARIMGQIIQFAETLAGVPHQFPLGQPQAFSVAGRGDYQGIQLTFFPATNPQPRRGAAAVPRLPPCPRRPTPRPLLTSDFHPPAFRSVLAPRRRARASQVRQCMRAGPLLFQRLELTQRPAAEQGLSRRRLR